MQIQKMLVTNHRNLLSQKRIFECGIDNRFCKFFQYKCKNVLRKKLKQNLPICDPCFWFSESNFRVLVFYLFSFSIKNKKNTVQRLKWIIVQHSRNAFRAFLIFFKILNGESTPPNEKSMPKILRN